MALGRTSFLVVVRSGFLKDPNAHSKVLALNTE